MKFDGELSESAVLYAVRSFPCRSAGEPDDLRPQHIRNMTGHTVGESGSFLLKVLTSFVQFVLDGEVLPSVCSYFLVLT